MQFNFTSISEYSYTVGRVGLMAAAALLVFCSGAAMAEEETSGAEASAQLEATEQASQGKSPVFATINGVEIKMRDFKLESARLERERYYHAKVQEHKLGEFQREVRDLLVEKVLLIQEVERRGAEVDAEELQRRVDETMASFDEQFGSSEEYQKERETVLGGITHKITNSIRMRDLESEVRASVVDPGDDVLKAYYQESLELFTQPGQYRISIILLGLDPSAGAQSVIDATEEAKGLVDALRAGNADFAELAEAISTDKSAANGGDMGYQHSGMLAPAIEAVLNDMSVGEISDPLRVLEGVSIIRLDERILPNVQPFDLVRERILGLWIRENQDKAWDDLIADLRNNADIKIYDSFFAPLPATEMEGKGN